MTRDDLWELLDRLESAGLAKLSDYTCEGTSEQCDDNPPGTMVLLHPGLSIEIPTDRAEVETIAPGQPTRCGMMAAGPCPPTDYLTPLDRGFSDCTWEYLFIEGHGE